MFELKLAGQKLAALPAVKNGVATDLNAGPMFARALINQSEADTTIARTDVNNGAL